MHTVVGQAVGLAGLGVVVMNHNTDSRAGNGGAAFGGWAECGADRDGGGGDEPDSRAGNGGAAFGGWAKCGADRDGDGGNESDSGAGSGGAACGG